MSERLHRSRLIPALVAVAGCALPWAAAVAQTAWAAPVSGAWSNFANWTSGLPSPVNPAVLGLTGAYVATVTGSTSVGAVTISNTAASLYINEGVTLSTANITNDGFILVNPSGINSMARLSPANGTSLGGTGFLRLNSAAADISSARIEMSGAYTHGVSHTIAGTGQLYNHSMSNAGLVDADVAGRALQSSFMTINNTGILTASAGLLQFQNTSVNNTGGLVSASGSGAVELYNSTITGGNLSGAGTAVVRAMSGHGPTISGLTITGNVAIQNNSNLNTGNADILNNGLITINDSAGGSATRLQLSGSAAVLGIGTIVLNTSVSDLYSARIEAPGGSVRTLGPGQLVRGTGVLYNFQPQVQGVIDADVPGRPLRLDFCTVTNAGTLRATAGTLQFTNSSVTNTAGLITATGGGAVELYNVGITGGTLSGLSGGVVRTIFGHSPSISGVTLLGNIAISNSSNLSVGAASITNNATILVNESAGGNTTRLDLSGGGSVLGTGTVVLNSTVGDPFTARVEAPGGAIRTLGPGQTVRGSGVFYNFNPQIQGLVDADLTGRVLRLDFCSAANTGTLRARNGGRLQVTNTAVTQTGPGIITAESGGQVELYNCTISGGVLNSTGTGTVRAMLNSSPTISGVTITGSLGIDLNSSLNTGAADIINNGVITVNTSGGVQISRLFLSGSAALQGTGTILLNATAGDPYLSRLEAPGGAARTFGPGQTIRGTGVFYNFNPTIQGLVLADQSGKAIRFDFCNATNQSEMAAVSGGLLQLVNSSLTQTSLGRLSAGDGAVVQLLSVTVTGGTIESQDTGIIEVPSGQSPTITGATILGRLNVNSGAQLNLSGGSIDGLITVNASASGAVSRFNPTAPVTSGAGVIRLNASSDIYSARFEPAGGSARTFGPDLTIAGRGVLYNFNPTIQGTLSPGFGPSDYNDILLDFCSAALAPTTVTAIEIGGQAPGNFDRVRIQSGSMTLGGKLKVTFGGTYTGQSGASFTIITGPVSGDFATLDLPPLGPGRNWVVVRTPTSYRLLIPCAYADITGIGGPPSLPDGQFTVDDIIAFVNLFGDGTGCPGASPCSAADITGIGGPPADPDGELTVDDIIAFVNAFGDGCQ
jgi:hypothetical protein